LNPGWGASAWTLPWTWTLRPSRKQRGDSSAARDGSVHRKGGNASAPVATRASAHLKTFSRAALAQPSRCWASATLHIRAAGLGTRDQVGRLGIEDAQAMAGHLPVSPHLMVANKHRDMFVRDREGTEMQTAVKT
jgi:hypothetical protein